ncbi:hypothetical protein [Cyanobacterium sp. Dongsha4]|uniref:hypothetical protein n=1 Tax=Cyanobacterium sp. DS4 TaxID=2878255 RepID=UPI002E806C36|nr:hypothetical protein [Cyanobacterium sp. Dongsha4]WVL00621.1 hypothetical protein Dongsha4_18585 [Cyanobacterium sp. Dongsha4]
MTIGKIANKIAISSHQKSVSPNLELINTTQKSIKNKAVKKSNNHSQPQKYLTIFKYLILSTTIIFSFGGLGFGLALRYGHSWEISHSQQELGVRSSDLGVKTNKH